MRRDVGCGQCWLIRGLAHVAPVCQVGILGCVDEMSPCCLLFLFEDAPSHTSSCRFRLFFFSSSSAEELGQLGYDFSDPRDRADGETAAGVRKEFEKVLRLKIFGQITGMIEPDQYEDGFCDALMLGLKNIFPPDQIKERMGEFSSSSSSSISLLLLLRLHLHPSLVVFLVLVNCQVPTVASSHCISSLEDDGNIGIPLFTIASATLSVFSSKYYYKDEDGKELGSRHLIQCIGRRGAVHKDEGMRRVERLGWKEQGLTSLQTSSSGMEKKT
eukprot:761555-Hanusia_phi.AAC.1